MGASARITGFEQRLKLAANELYSRTSPIKKLKGWMVPRGCAFHAVSALGPVQDPVSDSDSQPLFATAHQSSGASFSFTVAARRAMSACQENRISAILSS
ncbi:MAG: hypothetical protein ABF303_03770 [Desulfobacterales bacterium]